MVVRMRKNRYMDDRLSGHTFLLQRLIVDETRGVLGDFKLPLLYVLAKLPVKPPVSAIAQLP